jgi:hypothetical protein
MTLGIETVVPRPQDLVRPAQAISGSNNIGISSDE